MSNKRFKTMLKYPNGNKYTTKSCELKKYSEENIHDGLLNLNFLYGATDLSVESINVENEECNLYMHSTLDYGICPYCGKRSIRVHSRYVRTVNDLSILGKKVIIKLEIRKFFCHNCDCYRKTFAEQPGNEVFRYRRRTRRCETVVIKQGLLNSSHNAQLLLEAMGIKVCNTTILRDLHRIPLNQYADVHNIGVDDWAFLKGVYYGSIIVNLDKSMVIDLLGNRERDGFGMWLERHDKVRMVSRDRSTEYSAAIAASGWNIIEVADRFHLIKNMSDCITKIIGEYYSDYRLSVRPEEEEQVSLTAMEVDNQKSSENKSDVIKLNSSKVKFNEVKELQAKGFKPTAIAKRLKIARQTATKYCLFAALPPMKSKARNEYYKYDDYVESEYSNGKTFVDVYKEIKEMGFKGAFSPFCYHYHYLSDGHRGYRSKKGKTAKRPKIQDKREPLLPIKTISLIAGKSIMKKSMEKNEFAIIDKLNNLDWFAELHEAAASFYLIIKGCNTAKLTEWIDKYKDTTIAKLKSFILGIRLDFKAVENCIKYNVSNGIVEGFVNKLKAVKRVMYGKAKLELLRRKMIVPAIIFN